MPKEIEPLPLHPWQVPIEARSATEARASLRATKRVLDEKLQQLNLKPLYEQYLVNIENKLFPTLYTKPTPTKPMNKTTINAIAKEVIGHHTDRQEAEKSHESLCKSVTQLQDEIEILRVQLEAKREETHNKIKERDQANAQITESNDAMHEAANLLRTAAGEDVIETKTHVITVTDNKVVGQQIRVIAR